MNKTVLSLILASVCLSSLAQIILKAGVSSDAVARSIAERVWWSTLADVAASPAVWLGMGVYFASALVWLFVLARVQVSFAYPFVGLGFVLTMLLGWGLYGDALTPARVGGTLLIAAGVAILSHS